jgi:hypothetical protein
MNHVPTEFAAYLRHAGDWTDSAIVRAARAAAPRVVEISQLSVIPEARVPARASKGPSDPEA